eukprot:1862350-Amphidinium_carterae.1
MKLSTSSKQALLFQQGMGRAIHLLSRCCCHAVLLTCPHAEPAPSGVTGMPPRNKCFHNSARL